MPRQEGREVLDGDALGLAHRFDGPRQSHLGERMVVPVGLPVGCDRHQCG